MADAGLLGVGNGVVRPLWLGKQEMAEKMAPMAPKANMPTGETKARDERITQSAVLELGAQITRLSATVDLANINAATTANTDIDVSVTNPGVVEAGDYIVCMGAAALEHGLVVQSTIPAPANDTIRVRVSNETAGAINSASQTFYFLVVKPTSII